jgi:hypothetical protein
LGLGFRWDLDFAGARISLGLKFRWGLDFAGARISLGLGFSWGSDFARARISLGLEFRFSATIRILSERIFRSEGLFSILYLPFISRESAIFLDIPVPLRLGRSDTLISNRLGLGLLSYKV